MASKLQHEKAGAGAPAFLMSRLKPLPLERTVLFDDVAVGVHDADFAQAHLAYAGLDLFALLSAIASRNLRVSIPWAVENFALIEVRQIDNGVQYRVIETYPLA